MRHNKSIWCRVLENNIINGCQPSKMFRNLTILVDDSFIKLDENMPVYYSTQQKTKCGNIYETTISAKIYLNHDSMCFTLCYATSFWSATYCSPKNYPVWKWLVHRSSDVLLMNVKIIILCNRWCHKLFIL